MDVDAGLINWPRRFDDFLKFSRAGGLTLIENALSSRRLEVRWLIDVKAPYLQLRRSSAIELVPTGFLPMKYFAVVFLTCRSTD